MTHFDMNPDRPDPRVLVARRASLRSGSGWLGAGVVAIFLAGLAVMALVIYVVAHFVIKYW